ncbi:alpha/beta fold hydrolase [Microbacterium dauci]|uniref:Alpha/beta hydrolase n=1 Tax=Microbacterium dauci TaxID=3048008 RepID=A0ABT6ZF36_9MICO|nr:alpha/beta hydrolase [Microbacterium sp. LX3-4]MDJ1114753.1 alpha/beta hydrolase [Microbacterium sp. LX3-4]
MTAPECTVFFLPGLGLDAAAAAPVAAALDDRFRVVPVELPGHGGAPDADDGSVDAQVDAALTKIQAHLQGERWLLCGHSMGGKVATRLAARALAGGVPVFGLMGVVLLAPSPPGPEPMPDEKREQMRSWIERGPIGEADARTFVHDNVGAPLSMADEDRLVASVRATSPLAWARWLEEGSLEDLREGIGALDLPCIVVAGDQDEALGAAAQPQLLSGVYPRARFRTLSSAGHLLSYERAGAVAEAIVDLWSEACLQAAAVPDAWARLIASERTVARARRALAARAVPDDPHYEPRVLDDPHLQLLREIAARLVPQPEGSTLDLAARVDATLATGGGDGWRPAGAPTDGEAYRRGLDVLRHVWPSESHAQDTLIAAVIAGEPVAGVTDPDGMRRWFEDVRFDLARVWLIHPASLARIGYSGFATGSADPATAGYASLAAGSRDDWEPAELGDDAARTRIGAPTE